MRIYADRHHGCRVNEYVWRGHRLIVLENELLRVGVVASKGADIVELRFKPRDVDFMWHSPFPLLPPGEYVPTTPSANGTFFDQYHGGWQESLPAGNGTPSYGHATLGLHGEVSSLPWDVRVVDDQPGRVAVEFSVRARRTPFWLRRTMILEREAPYLRLDEVLMNEGEEAVPYMWGHHPAFGPPLVCAGCVLDLPPGPLVVSANQQHGRYAPGPYAGWPDVRGRAGEPMDASHIPPKEARAVDTLYVDLSDLPRGYAAVRNVEMGLGVGLEWDARVFRYVWCWQAYGGSWGYPFYGRTYHVALEPFNAPIGSLEDALRAESGGHLDAGAEVTTSLRAGVIAGHTSFTGF